MHCYRRDSFITHRAFCDAIAEENNKANTLQRQISSNQQPELISSIISSINGESNNKYDNPPTETTSSDQFKHMMIKNPLTLDHHHNSLNTNNMAAGSLFSRPTLNNNMLINNTTTNISSSSAPLSFDQQNGNHFGFGGEQFYMSATALLQKAAQMGSTTTNSDSSAMAPSTYAALDQLIKKDHQVQEYQMSSSTNNTTTITTPPLPPQFFDVNGHNNNDDNDHNKNVGIFSGLLFDNQNHAAAGSAFLKNMEQSMSNDNASNVVLHGANNSSVSVTGGDVMTVDFLGIGRSASAGQGNFHEQKKQAVVVNNLRFGGINGLSNMQSTLTQFQQHAGLMEKQVWEV